MWEQFAQNNQLWLPAGLGGIAILTALYYQLFGWRSNGLSIDVSLLSTFLLAIVCSVVFPRLVPYPPFTWLQWFVDNVPKNCSGACLERHFLFVSTILIVSVALFAIFQVILWGPWWLVTSRQTRPETCQVEELEREEESNPQYGDVAPIVRILILNNAEFCDIADKVQLTAGLHDSPTFSQKTTSSVQPQPHA